MSPAHAGPRILKPLEIRGTRARNRLWLPPMCMYSAEAGDGRVTDWHLTHYASRSVGGFGTIIVEATAVTPEGRLSPQDLGLWDDRQVEGHRRLARAIAEGGALPGIQLGHGGRKAGTPAMRPAAPGARRATLEGWELLAPSPIAYPGHAVPAELDAAGIERLVGAFAAASRRAVEAGYEVIEIHGAHGYLIHEFLSPLSNERSDDYGGDAAGRRRFALRVAQAVREAIGDERALGVRLSATDWLEGGLTLEDTADLAGDLVAAGVDVLHISSGGNAPAEVPVGPGYQLPLAEGVRRAVQGRAPVVGVGLIQQAAQAEQALASGQADAIAVGRAALRDPYLPLRWAADLGARAWDEAPWPVQYWRGTWQ